MTREEAKREIQFAKREVVEGSWIDKAYDMAIEALSCTESQCESAQVSARWVPCSERLPKDDDYKPFSYYEDGVVFFCTKDGKVGFGWYYESTREWANEDDNTVGNVIAWMELPEPYREE